MLFFRLGVITFILTFISFIGFCALIADKVLGTKIMFFVSIGWLLRYFEHASYLLLYDNQNIDRWILVFIPISLATTILLLAYKRLKVIQEKTFSFKTPILIILFLASIGLFSFVRKPHVNEFNCWYYFDDSKKDYKITFAITPEHIFETTTDSKELKEFVLKYGIRDKYRKGIYCPETKVRVITCFKNIVGLKILGFRNSTTNYNATLNEPFELDINKVYGDKGILQPDFNMGD